MIPSIYVLLFCVIRTFYVHPFFQYSLVKISGVTFLIFTKYPNEIKFCWRLNFQDWCNITFCYNFITTEEKSPSKSKPYKHWEISTIAIKVIFRCCHMNVLLLPFLQCQHSIQCILEHHSPENINRIMTSEFSYLSCSSKQFQDGLRSFNQ